MPISDNPNYPERHFKRVYEHLIVPACENAGFEPIRADLVTNTNYIALDVIKKIIESDMVLCDLSSQNPNVLYELGIRQAFNKPVTLIKDKKTKRIFDIQGFRDYEYDESLRVDNVQDDVEKLSEALLATFDEDSNDINSLVSLLSLSPAKIESNTKISKETKLILNSLSEMDKRISSIEDSVKNKYPKISDVDHIFPNSEIKYYGGGVGMTTKTIRKFEENIGEPYSREELSELKEGEIVYHKRFGFGEVLKVIDKREEFNPKMKAEINFNDSGIKVLLLRFSSLRKVL